ncbi:helix-turn-helix transcriptional regulator [Streptomyces erythrochromogenes]|uniref:helix-turn-helix transcriptional regulator n=1 Tax=Streptomyces erythrochromogenes TaxID=285574 RepID=UPI003827C7F5
MELHEVIRKRRGELNMSQAELAAAAGVDRRQIRRYEAGEQQPVLSVAVAIARALGITVNELAGQPAHRVDLAGTWWMSWQTSRDGESVVTAQEVNFAQQEELIHLDTVSRGLSVEAGGYHWRGELRLWDQEVLMGWYVANDGPVRSKGTLYFVLHPHGISMSGRWVGLGYDGKIMTGWGTAARSKDEALELNAKLQEDQGASL